MRVLVTGSSGLVGSQAVRFYDGLGHEVWGIDNNQRADYFGPGGDTSSTLRQLIGTTRFVHRALDVRDRESLDALFEQQAFDLVVHCAAQPSHDLAREIPLIDFDVNAVGTLNLLEVTRRRSPEAVFVLLSTNKVYGDAPNELPLVETATRFDYARPQDRAGIREDCRIDRSLHSIFGASKAAADLMAQEYARTFGMRVGVFRCGCLTGAAHAGVLLHGFLSYLARCAVRGTRYTVLGYGGKQVRDNLHAEDVVTAIEAFRAAPRSGEVYNLGGGRDNSVSILEAIARLGERLGRSVDWDYVDRARLGDHICYISDLGKFCAHYPEWHPQWRLDDILDELVACASPVEASR